MGRRGMTLAEMMIVVIIIGILARLVIPRYLMAVEKGRSAEARYALGVIRDAETSYYVDQEAYGTMAQLNLNYPSSCTASYYFTYSLSINGASYVATATRCTSGGKPPKSYTAYVINMTQTGALDGSTGFV